MSTEVTGIMTRSQYPSEERSVITMKLRKIALWLVAALLVLGGLWIAYPDLFQGSSNTFETPKGDYVVRVDKSGKNPTAFIPDEEAQRNNVKLVVTFQSGIVKTCNGRCPVEGDIRKIEAKVGDEVIATWP